MGTMQADAPKISRVPTEVDAGEMVQFLSDPRSFKDGSLTVELQETHISWVALTDRRAYKVKKPVSFSFLDYSTLDRRLAACRDELRLGGRLAPGVYIGYQPITRDPFGKLRFGCDGKTLDYCVVMKRLPADRMLDRLINQGVATADDIDLLLNILIPFYETAARGTQINEFATAAAIERQARQNLATIDTTNHGLPESQFLRVRASQLQYLKLSAGLFARRIRDGRVCEGHGDLRAEHVCMTSPPVVFDCVEFSQPLRSADVISELAFLAMDCDFLGAPKLGTALIERYKARTADAPPSGLTSFYKSYRACVRAKVELLRADQEAGPAAVRSVTRARRYLQLASAYATDFYRPKLFVMVGAAGTGKSTVAAGLADALGLSMLRTDSIRHELAGSRDLSDESAEGIYSDSMTSRTYDTLFHRAELLLAQAVSVVLDGTFRAPEYRDRAIQLAHQCGAQLHFVYCRCSPELARARIADRLAGGDRVSDAHPAMHDHQQAELQSAVGWENPPVITLDTSQSPVRLIGQVLDAVAAGPC